MDFRAHDKPFLCRLLSEGQLDGQSLIRTRRARVGTRWIYVRQRRLGKTVTPSKIHSQDSIYLHLVSTPRPKDCPPCLPETMKRSSTRMNPTWGEWCCLIVAPPLITSSHPPDSRDRCLRQSRWCWVRVRQGKWRYENTIDVECSHLTCRFPVFFDALDARLPTQRVQTPNHAHPRSLTRVRHIADRSVIFGGGIACAVIQIVAVTGPAIQVSQF